MKHYARTHRFIFIYTQGLASGQSIYCHAFRRCKETRRPKEIPRGPGENMRNSGSNQGLCSSEAQPIALPMSPCQFAEIPIIQISDLNLELYSLYLMLFSGEISLLICNFNPGINQMFFQLQLTSQLIYSNSVLSPMHHCVNNWSVKQVILSPSFLNTLIKAYRPVFISSLEILTADWVTLAFLRQFPTSMWFQTGSLQVHSISYQF